MIFYYSEAREKVLQSVMDEKRLDLIDLREENYFKNTIYFFADLTTEDV